jgi:hypothetical protein
MLVETHVSREAQSESRVIVNGYGGSVQQAAATRAIDPDCLADPLAPRELPLADN